MVRIFDFGEGDEVVVHRSAFLRREDGGLWSFRSSSDARLQLPEPATEGGAGTQTSISPQFLAADGRWHPLQRATEPSDPSGRVWYTLQLKDIRDGRTTLRLSKPSRAMED
jgi:hypothetical protein